MTIEINKRLDVGGRRFSEEEFEKRSSDAVADLGKFVNVKYWLRWLPIKFARPRGAGYSEQPWLIV